MTMRKVLALFALALALAAPARAQIYPGYGTPTLLGDGSASAPSYSFASHQTSGFYLDPAGLMSWTQAGTANVVFGSSVGLVASVGRGVFWYTAVGSGSYANQSGIAYTGANTLGVQAGASTANANLGGVLSLNVTSAGNVGAGDQTIMTYTLPANVLSVNGKTVRVSAWGRTANNVNAKTITIFFCSGGSAYTMTTSLAAAWSEVAYFVRTGSGAQANPSTMTEAPNSGIIAAGKVGAQPSATRACTDTGSILIEVRGNGTASNDIIADGMLVELLN